jgi:dihydroflavonol-4-reductase
MRVLVTGATGFIGANLVRHLLARGDEVRALVRKPNAAIEGLPLTLVSAPLDDSRASIEALARAVEGCDGVYHVAGLFDPSPGGEARMWEVHLTATRALLSACDQAGVPRLLVCSSSITVGWGPRSAPGDEDSPLDPAVYGKTGALRVYHDSKLQSEQLAATWPGPTKAVIVNPDYIIGPWDIKPTSGQLIVSMARQPWVPVHPRGGKCFQDVDDCAIGHILALEKGTPGRRYLLGNENLSYAEFMGIVAEVTGKPRPRIPLPNLAVALAGRVGALASRIDPHKFAGLDGNVLRSMQSERYRSARRAEIELGLPRTPIRVAVEKAYRWFVDHGYC